MQNKKIFNIYLILEYKLSLEKDLIRSTSGYYEYKDLLIALFHPKRDKTSSVNKTAALYEAEQLSRAGKI